MLRPATVIRRPSWQTSAMACLAAVGVWAVIYVLSHVGVHVWDDAGN